MVDPDYSALTVANVITSFVPKIIFTSLRHTYPHTIRVKTGRLGEVANVERDFLLFKHFSAVLNAVVEPLVVTGRVGVNPHVQVILIVPHFRHHVQIATLKQRIEFKLAIEVD